MMKVLIRQHSSAILLGLVSFATAAIIVAILCYFFQPQWESNDDVGMAMVAHGFGLAAIGTPKLFFSNILWGYIVRLIPTVHGVLGYSIATLSVLIIVAAIIIYGLCRMGHNFITVFSIVSLILVRPVLFPQFTINAGLLMVSAIICWHLCMRKFNIYFLISGCILAFCSYLIRNQEFFLIVIVTLPLLLQRAFLSNRAVKIAGLITILAIGSAAIIDYQAYQNPDWKKFNEFNSIRALMTDFGVGTSLMQRPDIFERHHFSTNDINLVRAYFYDDPNLINPIILKTMLSELGLFNFHHNTLENAWAGVRTLWHPTLLPVILAAFLLLVFIPSWRLIMCWGLSITLVATLGLLGRPGVMHIYVPLDCLLLIAPCFNLHSKLNFFVNRLITIILFALAITNISTTFSESKKAEITSAHIRKGLANFPHHLVIVWGGDFPFEAASPVLSSDSLYYKFYGVGCFSLAPFSVPFVEQKNGRGMIPMLLSKSSKLGIPIIATPYNLDLLSTYCKEHFNGHLKKISMREYGEVKINWLRCDTTSANYL